MFLAVAVLHIVVSIILVVFVLLQNPKGGALGLLGGSGADKSVLSAAGAPDFLVTVTKWCAVVFALTSIQLAYMSSKKGSSVILDKKPETEQQEKGP